MQVARHNVLPSQPDSGSECSSNSETSLTEAEVTAMKIDESLKRVLSWRTASLKKSSQGHLLEKTIASRKDIGKYAEEPACMAGTVDLTPEGPPANY